MLDKLHLGISYSALGCELRLINEQYILNEVSLSQNTHKVRVCIDQLLKMVLQAHVETKPCIFPESNDSIFVNSVLITFCRYNI